MPGRLQTIALPSHSRVLSQRDHTSGNYRVSSSRHRLPVSTGILPDWIFNGVCSHVYDTCNSISMVHGGKANMDRQSSRHNSTRRLPRGKSPPYLDSSEPVSVVEMCSLCVQHDAAAAMEEIGTAP